MTWLSFYVKYDFLWHLYYCNMWLKSVHFVSIQLQGRLNNVLAGRKAESGDSSKTNGPGFPITMETAQVSIVIIPIKGSNHSKHQPSWNK